MMSRIRDITRIILLPAALLSRLPFCGAEPLKGDWKWISSLFPFWGIVIGAICGLPFLALLGLNRLGVHGASGLAHLPSYALNMLGAFMYVSTLAWLTRGLHIDGFCDSCDAFSLVGPTPARRLEVMKDPHPGSLAVAAACLLLTGKTIVVFLLLQMHCDLQGLRDAVLKVIPLLLLLPASARFAMLFLACVGSYAREEGTGGAVIRQTTWLSVGIGLTCMLPFLLFISTPALGFLCGVMILNALLWERKAHTLLGGITGDILGACVETSEVLAGLVLLLA